jgi:hypothetical protein
MKLRNLGKPFSQLISGQEINNLVRFESREQGGGESKLHEGQLPTVSIIYFTGAGHRAKLAEAKGATSVGGMKTNLIAISGRINRGRECRRNIIHNISRSTQRCVAPLHTNGNRWSGEPSTYRVLRPVRRFFDRDAASVFFPDLFLRGRRSGDIVMMSGVILAF